MSLPIYSNLIIKADSANLNQVQAQIRRTFSDNNLTLDVLSPAKLNEINKVLATTRRQATGLLGDFQGIGKQVDNVFRRFSAYLIASGGILTTIALFKSAVGEALKFQNELVRVKQVSGDADSVIKKLGMTISDLAKTYGVSSAELSKSATILKQAGLTTVQTTKALEALAKTDLAPNFDSIAKTTEGLIAIFQQFGRNIDDVEGQLGSLNAVAGAFAVEASDLITLVQKAGGAAASSGASFQELLGIFTSVRATTRESADAISTGLRTIFGRLQRPDTIKFLDELGIKMRYTAEEAEKLGQADLAGKFVGPFEAITRIAQGTSSLGKGSTLFSNIVEEIGGLRQLSRVVPLLRETATAVEALNVAQAGKASLDIQASIKADSYLNQLNKIKETFLAIGRTLVESEGFNRFIQFLDTAARASIKLLDALGPLLPYLGIIVGGNIAAGALGGAFKGGYRAFGGNVNTPPPKKGYASGGIIPGASTGDIHPVLLEGGEAVIPAKSVRRYPTFIKSLISGQLPGFAGGYMPGDSGFTSGRLGSIDVERALVEIAKRTGVNPEEIVKKIRLVKGLESVTHPGQEAAGSMSKSGIMKLNPNQIKTYSQLVDLLAHETGHGRANKLGLLQDPAHKKLLTDPSVVAQAEAFAKSTKQSFAPTGRYGVPYAMTSSEMTANLFAAGNQDVIKATEAEKARAAAYIAKKESMLANYQPPQPRELSSLDKLANRVNYGLNRGYNATLGRILPKIDIPSSPETSSRPSFSPSVYGGSRDSGIYNSLVDEHFNNQNTVSSSKIREIGELQKRQAQLKDTIAELELGRKQGRIAYPKHFRGDALQYIKEGKFQGLGANAQAYLQDKGAYLGNLRQQQINLADVQAKIAANPPPPTPYSIRNIQAGAGGIGNFGVGGIGTGGGGFGGYGPPSPGNPYIPHNNSFPNPPGGVLGGQYGVIGGAHIQNVINRGALAGQAGGTGLGGLGLGGAANNGLPSTKSILSSINNNRKFNAFASSAGILAPLALGYLASKSKDPVRQNEFGGAAIGSSIGGTLGSALGPIVAVIGSAIGGITGWFLGASTAAKELEKTTIKNKLDTAIQGLNETIENIASGSGSISDLTKNLEDLRKQSIAKAISDTSEGGDFIKASSDEFKKNAGLQLPALTRLLGEEVKKQAKSGGEFNTEGDVGKLIRSVASLRGASPNTISAENKKLFDAARLDQINKEANTRFTIEINKSVASATAFAEAVGRAAEETKALDEKLRVLTSGGYEGASINVGEFGNINKKALNTLNGFGGGALGALTGQVGSVDQISKYLPEVLSRVVKPGQQSGDNLAGDFASVFKSIGEQTGVQFDKKIINVLADKLQGLKSDDLFEDFKKAPEKFAKEFISSYEPSLKALQGIGKSLEERDKAYQDGLRHLLQLNDKFNALSEQRASQSTQYSQIIDGFKLSNAGIDPSRAPNIGSVFGPFNREQDRLLGQQGIGGSSAAIVALIQQREEEVKALREKAKQEADSGKATTAFRDALNEAEKKLANANRALERLANASERVAILQQAIAAAENLKSGKLDLTKRILTSSPQELLQLNRQAQGADVFIKNGAAVARNKFGPKGLEEIIGALEDPSRFGNVKIPSRLNKNGIPLLGKEIPRVLLEEENVKARGKINVREENVEIAKNQALIKNILEEAGAGVQGGASGAIAANLLKTAEDFKKILGDNNTEFFKKIDQYIDELQKNALQAEKATKQIRLNEISGDVSAANELSTGTFKNSGGTVEELRKNISAVRAANSAQFNLDTINKQAGSNAVDAEKFIKDNLGKLSPKEIAGRLGDFGFDENQRKKVLASIENVDIFDKKKIDSELNKLTSVDDSGNLVIKDQKRYDELNERKKKGVTNLPPEFFGRLVEIQTEEAQKKVFQTRRQVRNKAYLNVSPKALDFLEKQGPDGINRVLEENKTLKEELGRINRDQSGGFDLDKASGFISGGVIGGVGDFDPRNAILNRRRPAVNDLGLFEPNLPKQRQASAPNIGPVSSFERANDVFTNFNSNFAKQVDALSSIPRVIDMNINQKVEVIINGADILNGLEPSMREIANGAVSRAVEVIGGQLRENNISISYSPTDTNEQTNPASRGRVA